MHKYSGEFQTYKFVIITFNYKGTVVYNKSE